MSPAVQFADWHECSRTGHVLGHRDCIQRVSHQAGRYLALSHIERRTGGVSPESRLPGGTKKGRRTRVLIQNDEVERQISESVWQYLDHRHFQGHVLNFYQPPGQVIWTVPDNVTFRLAPGGVPFGLPFAVLAGNLGANSAPRLDNRPPCRSTSPMVGSTERALRELYHGAIIGGAEGSC